MKLAILMPIVLVGVSACGGSDNSSVPVEQSDPVTEIPDSTEPTPEPEPEPDEAVSSIPSLADVILTSNGNYWGCTSVGFGEQQKRDLVFFDNYAGVQQNLGFQVNTLTQDDSHAWNWNLEADTLTTEGHIGSMINIEMTPVAAGFEEDIEAAFIASTPTGYLIECIKWFSRY